MALDIFHLSYQEPYADKTWKSLVERFPYARRVKGIKGIFNAHKRCAELAYTKSFYVVDADAILEPDFDFSFKPSKWDEHCTHVWRCKNPINDLVYGYGGVKLFPTETCRSANEWRIDFTTSVSNKPGEKGAFKAMPTISNVTAFNTDPFNTFKSAFRECTKLASKVIDKQKNAETEQRLDIWCSVGGDRGFGEYAIAGAIAGREYGETNKNNMEALSKINDFGWLEQQFNKIQISSRDARTIR